MKNTNVNNNLEDSKAPDYLNYPASEDIYRQGKKEENVDPSNPSRMKQTSDQNSASERKELDFNISKTGDLDVPGSELDDEMENVGSEDEENNYYSIGGDNHENLEEGKGEYDR